MAIDLKYGRITTEHGDIGEDEPVVVFRAKDELLPQVLTHYLYLCRSAGSPQRHQDLIQRRWHEITEWQDENGSRTPTSESSRAWLDT